MDLGDVLSLTEYEQGMYQRVEVYEQQLCSHAGQEIQAAVHRHEKWLNDQATAEVQRSRKELQTALREQDAHLQQLALVPHRCNSYLQPGTCRGGRAFGF